MRTLYFCDTFLHTRYNSPYSINIQHENENSIRIIRIVTILSFPSDDIILSQLGPLRCTKDELTPIVELYNAYLYFQ